MSSSNGAGRVTLRTARPTRASSCIRTWRRSNTGEEDQRSRRAEMHRVFGERSRPIMLEDDRGKRAEEVGRLVSQEPQQAAPGQSFSSRFLVMFDAPSGDAKSATLVVPFVEL